MTLKVLFIADGITPFTIGGMQRHSNNLIKSLLNENVHVTLGFTVNDSEPIPSKKEVYEALGVDDSVEEKFRHEVFRLENLSKIPGHYVRNSKRMSVQMCRSFNRQLSNFDVVYCKGLLGWEFVNQRSRGKLKIPVVVNLHGYEMFQEAPNLKVKLQHMLLLRNVTRQIVVKADYVVSYGAKITTLLKSLGLKKIIELPSGVTKDWIVDGVKEVIGNKVNVVFLGRFERRKGIQEIHEAIRSHNSELSKKFNFHFIGPIPKEEQVTVENTFYHGEKRDINEIKALLDDMDVLLCPSYSEGMPNVILEAMSRGMGVIATDVGAVSLMVGEDNGVLLNSPTSTSIVDALKRLDKEMVNEMKVNSLKKIKCFQWSEIAKLTVSKLQEVVNEAI